MADSRSSKEIPAPAGGEPDAGHSAGRIVHDERGNAVWDWAQDTGRFTTSTLLKKLNIADLKFDGQKEQPPPSPSAAPVKPRAAPDPGGGYNPYDQKKAVKKPTAPAGPVGKPQFKPQTRK